MKVKIDEYNRILCPHCGHHETQQAEPAAFCGGISIRLFCGICKKEWELAILKHQGLTLIENFGCGEVSINRHYEFGDLIRIYEYSGCRKLVYSHYEKNNTMEKTLKKALLEGIDLKHAIFIGNDFSNSNLMGLNLNGIRFWGCNMKNVNLIGSSLNGIIFDGSDLTGAEYTTEQMTTEQLEYINLSKSGGSK